MKGQPISTFTDAKDFWTKIAHEAMIGGHTVSNGKKYTAMACKCGNPFSFGYLCQIATRNYQCQIIMNRLILI